ncbi:MAG: sulfotransferase [bacterium]|nr:sulfotransferase [bacterium]
MAEKPPSASQALPIVVGGFYRSGTSLVRRMLDSHSSIYCGPEVNFFRDFYGDFRDDRLARLRFFQTVRSVEPDETSLLRIFGEAYVKTLENAAARNGKRRWADKNPENALYLKEWSQLLRREFFFIHCVRHPLDAISSLVEAKFPLTVPPSFKDKVALYRRFVEAGLRGEERRQGSCQRIRYEDLVCDPESVLVGVVSKMGEAYEPAMLEFNEHPHDHGLEDRKIDESKGVHGESLGRYRKNLSRRKIRYILNECSEIMTRLNYSELVR